MQDTFEKVQLEKIEIKMVVLLDALERASGDLNEDGVNNDNLDYAWVQLSRASQALDKIRCLVQAIRTRRQSIPDVFLP